MVLDYIVPQSLKRKHMLVFSKAINGEGGPYDDVVVYWVTAGFTTQREKGPVRAL